MSGSISDTPSESAARRAAVSTKAFVAVRDTIIEGPAGCPTGVAPKSPIACNAAIDKLT
jgi:hypothetical protein